MASTYAKRLAKLEELLASRINQPLAYLWLNAGETQEQACIRCGYDPSQASRIRFCRWLTPEENAVASKPHWDDPDPGLPDDAGQTVKGEVPRSEAGATPAPREPDPADVARYRDAIEQQEREDTQEKLDIAAKLFIRSIA
jgi:hypothetical protein